MAIALDFDFRSTPAANSVEPGSRQSAGKDKGGEFAALLSRSRDEAAPGDALEIAAAGAEAIVLPQLAAEDAALPEEVLIPTDAEVPTETDTAAPPVEGETEIEIDRDLNLDEAIETQAERPSDMAALLPSRLQPDEQAQTLPAEPVQVEPAPNTDAETRPTPESDRADAAAQPLASTPLPAAQPAAAKLTEMASDIIVPADAKAAKLAETPAPAVRAASKEAAEPDLELLSATQPIPTDAGAADPMAAFAPADKMTSGDTALTAPQPLTVAAVGGAPVHVSAPAAAPVAGLAPTQAVLVAAPAQIVDIVSKTAADGTPDRVVVQLDPPELGRVSIDFKFDANGLQHVIITSETPEAMRQLRAMHTELMQALERQGLDGQNLSFQHQQQSGQQQNANAALLRMLQASPGAEAAATAPLPADTAHNTSLAANGRLDIRL